MKLFLSLCMAAVGLAGFASTGASAAEAPVKTLPTVVHLDETVILVHHHHHHHHRHWHHRHHWHHY